MTKTKDSGIEWMGNIPAVWSISRLKFLCDIKTGSKDTVDSNPEGGYPFFVRSSEVKKIDEYSYDCEAVLTAGDGDVGKIFHYINGKYDCHQRVYNLNNFRNIEGKFVYYFMMVNFIKEVEKGTAKSTVESLRLPMLKNFPICFPPNQDKIIKFLDYGVLKIDKIIAMANRQVELLEEYKKSIIVETVTNGLNPNVPMKDSGVNWIGRIPNNWKIVPLKTLFRIKKEIAGTLGLDVLSVTQKGIKIKNTESNEGQISQDYSKYQIVEPGDFVMNHMDLLTGSIDCSKSHGVTSPDYRVFFPHDDIAVVREYFNFLFQSCYANRIFYGLGQGVSKFGRWRLPADNFLNFPIPLPTVEEQTDISKYLTLQSSVVDSSIEKIHQLVELMEEYKKSFIYEYVTGKKQIEV